jgi:hypothetical protein
MWFRMFEALVPIYQTTRCHIQADLYVNIHICETHGYMLQLPLDELNSFFGAESFLRNERFLN